MIRKYAVLLVLLVVSLVPVSAFQYDLVYDDNGNLVDNIHHFYEYNGLNQLVGVRIGDATGPLVAEYAYDHEGNRIKKVTYDSAGNAETTYYVSREFVSVDDGSGREDTVFYHDGVALVGRKDSQGRFFYHPNHLGSTHIVTDLSGAVVERTNYFPFGTIFEGGLSRYLFTGQEHDPESSLMYYRARYYDPFLRHFTQPDTLLPDIYDPQQLNRYSYVMNNPVRYTDPSGHFVPLAIAFGGALVAAFSFFATVIFPAVAPHAMAFMAMDDLETVGDFAENPTIGGGLSSTLVAADYIGTPGIPEGKIARKGAEFVGKGTSKLGQPFSRFYRRTAPVDELVPSQPSLDANRLHAVQSEMRSDGFRADGAIRFIQDSNGRKIVTDGHHRLVAAMRGGMKEVPIEPAPKGVYGKYVDGRGGEVRRTFDEAVRDADLYKEDFWRSVDEVD